MFVDEAEIYVKAGDGGDGAVRFRRESKVPRGGPFGGDGGDGGDVIFRARPGLDTLLDLRRQYHWRAENGNPGETKDMTGAAGKDLVIDVPPGTLVYDKEHKVLLKDLDKEGMQVVIARGGKGGRGNSRFATATNQTPRIAEPGGQGEERHLALELKLIADVGLVGLPNAGKSTLLSRLSAAHPKIADYPFTTLHPNLGIVEAGTERRFVMADLPGLIEGAHAGVGLGDEFLRHVERTRLLVHLVEVEPHTHQPPADVYRTIRRELASYSPALAAKPELVVLTKTDLLGGDPAAAREFSKAIGRPVLAISSATGDGLVRLVKAILDQLDEIAAESAAEIKAATAPVHVPPHLRAELMPTPPASPKPATRPVAGPPRERKDTSVSKKSAAPKTPKKRRVVPRKPKASTLGRSKARRRKKKP
jgi:GTPase